MKDGSVSEESIAFTVKGVGITDNQRAVAISAMMGSFTKNDVRAALVRAGVPWSVPGERHLADRAADRLCQAERRAGNVRAVNNKSWERVRA